MFKAILLASTLAVASAPCLAAPTTASGPFDAGSASLPAQFAGHDCFAIARTLKRVAKPKSEFETNAAFEDRIASLASVNLVGNTEMADLIAIAVNPLALSMKYDAEDGEATFGIEDFAIKTALVGDKLAPMIVTTQRKVSERSYLGSNAFGVRAKVSETRYAGCGVTASNVEPMYMRLYANVSAKIAPETAQRLKAHLGAVMIGKVVAPFLSRIDEHSAATIDFPLESTTEGEAIVVQLKDIWYFNRQTGEVAAKTSRKK
jgi:hypothetical protein